MQIPNSNSQPSLSDVDNESVHSQSSPIMGAKEKHSATKDLLKEDSEKGLLKLSSV